MMRIVLSGVLWLLRGGLGRWVGALLGFAVIGSLLVPVMGPATEEVFGLLVVLGLLMIIYRLMVGGGRRKR